MRKGILANRKAGMEMSVGTIVTIVLLVSVLILGIFLIQQIFKGAKGAVDLSQQALENELSKLFAEDKKMVIYPVSKFVEIKQGKQDGVGIGIKNLLEGVTGSQSFSYDVVVSSPGKCAESKEQILGWIEQGKSESNINIPVGDLSAQKVLIRPPEGSSLCTVRFRVNVNSTNVPYATDFFDIKVVA